MKNCDILNSYLEITWKIGKEEFNADPDNNDKEVIFYEMIYLRGINNCSKRFS